MSLKKILGTSILVAGLTAGCASNPKPGQFNKSKSVALPHLPIIMALQGGSYKIKKDIDRGGNWVGVDITKKHLVFGKQGSQYIAFPKGASNVGMDNDNFFNDRFKFSYDLPDGQRHMKEYHIGYGAGKQKLSGEYIFDDKKDKYLKIK